MNLALTCSKLWRATLNSTMLFVGAWLDDSLGAMGLRVYVSFNFSGLRFEGSGDKALDSRLRL